MRITTKRVLGVVAGAALVLTVSASAFAVQDWGSKQQADTASNAMSLFAAHGVI